LPLAYWKRIAGDEQPLEKSGFEAVTY